MSSISDLLASSPLCGLFARAEIWVWQILVSSIVRKFWITVALIKLQLTGAGKRRGSIRYARYRCDNEWVWRCGREGLVVVVHRGHRSGNASRALYIGEISPSYIACRSNKTRCIQDARARHFYTCGISVLHRDFDSCEGLAA
jgi:hypothetical protein